MLRASEKYLPVGGPKMSTFCQRSYHRKCQRRGVGGQKSQNSRQGSLWTTPYAKLLVFIASDFHSIA